MLRQAVGILERIHRRVSVDIDRPTPDRPTADRDLPAPVAAVRSARGGMFSALANRNYRIYLSGSFVSNIGTWMQRVAQDWLVLELSGGSGLAVGITTGLQFLPMLLLSPYGGLIADRFDKRRVLKLTQGWLALCAAVLGLLAIGHVAATWHVYLIAFAFGLGTAFDNPARQAFVPEVSGPAHLANAIGLNSARLQRGPDRRSRRCRTGHRRLRVRLGDPVQRRHLRSVRRRLGAAGLRRLDHPRASPAGQAADPCGAGLRHLQGRPPAGLVRGLLRRNLWHELPDDLRADGPAGISPGSGGVRHPRHDHGRGLARRRAGRRSASGRAPRPLRGRDGPGLPPWWRSLPG